MLYVITDTHLFHKSMEHLCGRPANFTEKIINHMYRLTEADILYHLGDVTIGNDLMAHEVAVKPLKCRKYLILGNHDKKTPQWYLDHGWDAVMTGASIFYYGYNIDLYHGHTKTHTVRSESAYPVVQIKGHSHNKTKLFEEGKIHLSIEAWGFAPISIPSLLGEYTKIRRTKGDLWIH